MKYFGLGWEVNQPWWTPECPSPDSDHCYQNSQRASVPSSIRPHLWNHRFPPPSPPHLWNHRQKEKKIPNLPAPWSHGAGPPRRSRLGLPWLLRPDLRPSPSPGTSPWRSPAVEAHHAAGLAPPHLCGAAAPPRSVDGRLPARRCARWSAPAPARPGGAAKHCRCPLPRPTRPTIRSPSGGTHSHDSHGLTNVHFCNGL